jgi:pimeloyl-ACP methyl ester carboxylesterase
MLLSVRKSGPQTAEPGKPDVVIIHGTGASSELFLEQMELLASQGHRVYMPDLRGHGETHEPGEHTDIDVHMSDLIETLNHSQVRFPAIFIGHSLGAIISVMMAERQPDLFERVLAISMPGRVPRLLSSIFGWVFLLPLEGLRGSLIHRTLPKRTQVILNTNRHSLRQIVNNFSSVDFVSKAPELRVPVHFSVGRMDAIALSPYVEKMHKLMPGSTLKIFEWSGHCCYEDQPLLFNQWLLEKVSTESASETNSPVTGIAV